MIQDKNTIPKKSLTMSEMSDKLLGPELSDIDDNTEERKGTISIFNGPEPDKGEP